MSQIVHDILILVVYMAACSGFYYLAARAFVGVVGFLGRKTKGSLALRVVSYLVVWIVTAALIVAPFFVALSFHQPVELAWAMLLMVLFVASLLPAARHIRKNMELLYEAGYTRRR
jgi:hypothetical protein